MGVADLLAGCAVFFVVGLLGTLNQTAIGCKILYPWKTADVLNCIVHNLKKVHRYGQGFA